ncbi:hypothetical protein EVAR_59289_1 [Eumeta japonica]|uniref:Uncharacterized protein n=1 Tax=Eumeta variegata TaxID=151549 RepID=A0A4C1Y929_EUMVA|nr:hypothetical protein EVAR_59289_1 [Eumeta japonica]
MPSRPARRPLGPGAAATIHSEFQRLQLLSAYENRTLWAPQGAADCPFRSTIMQVNVRTDRPHCMKNQQPLEKEGSCVNPNYLSELSLSELFEVPAAARKQNDELATSVGNAETLNSIRGACSGRAHPARDTGDGDVLLRHDNALKAPAYKLPGRRRGRGTPAAHVRAPDIFNVLL